MPEMNACFKCRLSLPNSYLTPVELSNPAGQKKKGYLCETCKTAIIAQQKGRTNGNG
jgi:hypothetical protein